MKTVYSKLISMVLAIALLITCCPTAWAAPSRNKGNVKYLSEVALIEAVSDEEAQKALTELKKEENGGFTDMITLDLNKGGQKKVYLAFKTSTNVDDAITDLAVMNMEGNFSMGNYEQVLSENMENFARVARDYRTIAAEFAANYAAGNVNAQTAYRQLNLYYNEENGVKTYMGDYMLNFPSSDEGFAEILFRGNLNIIVNLRDLMAMGIGNGENKLSQRIADSYVLAETDTSIYSNLSYTEAAEAILEDVEEMKKTINNLENELAAIKADTSMDDELRDFVLATYESNGNDAKAFLELLKEIPLGESTLGDYIMNTAVIDASKLYPIAAAGTDAERTLMEYHSLYSVLLYDELSLIGEELEATLQELEAGVEPLSVYHGVQNDLVTGSIGITGNAESYTNSSGKSFFGIFSNDETQGSAIAFTVLGGAGVASMVGGVAYLGAKLSALSATNAAKRVALQGAIDNAQKNVNLWTSQFDDFVAANKYINEQNPRYLSMKFNKSNWEKELVCAKANINKASSYAHLSGKQIALGGGLIIAGLVMIGISIWQLTKIYNQYEITYTDIPDNMVHVVNYDDGDRFVNYKNVRSYYYDGDELKNRENDLNAYDGRQWVSLYYTKNYEAGYCLTASPDLIATEAGKTGYSNIHLFDRSDNYNTNSYCNRENAEAVYLAFKYSTNQKSAVTDVPAIIGSLFNVGTIAISAFVGFSAGVVLMACIHKKRMKAAIANA